MALAVRYCFLLPYKFNDGRPIPKEYRLEVGNRLRERFGSVTIIGQESSPIDGSWTEKGALFEDQNQQYIVDILDRKDETEADKFFREFKAFLEQKFEQKKIHMWTSVINVIE